MTYISPANSVTSQSAASGEKPSAAKIVLWTVLFQLAWHFRKIIPFMQEGSFNDSDDFLRLHQVRNWMGGQGWFDMSVPRMNLPDGGDMHWSRMVDVPIAGLTRFFDLFVETQTAERLTAVIWPSVLVVATVFVLLAICEKLFPQTNRLLALLFTVTSITALAEFAPSRIDHHGIQILAYTLTLLGLVNTEKTWGNYLIGASIAFSVAIGLDVFLMLVFILAWLGFEWVLGIDKTGKGLAKTAIAMLVASVVLYLINIAPSQWFVPRCDANSIVYLSGLWLISAAFLVMAASTSSLTFDANLKTWSARVALGAILAAGAASILYAFFPQCSAGPLSTITPELNEEWLSKISEAKGLIDYIREDSPATIGIPVYLSLIIGAGALLMRKHKASSGFLAIWVSVVICFLLGFVQVRAFRIGIFATVPICVMIAQYAWERLSARFEGKKVIAMAMTALLTAFLLTPTWLVVGDFVSGVWAVETSDGDTAAAPSSVGNTSTAAPKTCFAQSDYSFLRSLPKGYVLNALNIGPAILVFTDHSVVGGNYHRNGDAILDIQRFFASKEDKAREIISRRQTGYVAICNNQPDASSLETLRDFMEIRLLAGKSPHWLERISPEGDNLLVFRVTGK